MVQKLYFLDKISLYSLELTIQASNLQRLAWLGLKACANKFSLEAQALSSLGFPGQGWRYTHHRIYSFVCLQWLRQGINSPMPLEDK